MSAQPPEAQNEILRALRASQALTQSITESLSGFGVAAFLTTEDTEERCWN
jgi:hypothetical protein